MFNCCSASHQTLGALSQLSSLMNTLKTTTHTLFNGQRQIHHRNRQTRTSATKSTTNLHDGHSVQQMTEMVNKLALDAGFENLTATVAELCPLISPIPTQKSSHWLESHISTHSFFENKTGFPPCSLTRPQPLTVAHLFTQSHIQTIVQDSLNSWHAQQTRGFKTDRSGSSGMGRISAPSNSPLEELRNSVYERLFPGNKITKRRTDKIKNLMHQGESNPETLEKIKVAFAEGYMANDKKEGETTKSTFMSRTVRVFVYLCIFWLVIQVLQLFTAMGGTGVRGLGVLNREQYEVNPEEITVSFEDVKGVAEAKQELQDVVEFLRDPDKFTALGAKLPKGVLLVGPPGIGKTLLARAVAGEAGVPFFHASGSEFDEIFVGTGAKRVRQLFSPQQTDLKRSIPHCKKVKGLKCDITII